MLALNALCNTFSITIVISCYDYKFLPTQVYNNSGKTITKNIFVAVVYNTMIKLTQKISIWLSSNIGHSDEWNINSNHYLHDNHLIFLTIKGIAYINSSRVPIKGIAIMKCDLFFHYYNAKEVLFYCFCYTKLCAKHQKTYSKHEFHLFCWDYVCKINEWFLVDCFHCEFRMSTQIIVCDYCITKCKKFSACGSLLMALQVSKFTIQNIYVNSNPELYQHISWKNCYSPYTCFIPILKSLYWAAFPVIVKNDFLLSLISFPW